MTPLFRSKSARKSSFKKLKKENFKKWPLLLTHEIKSRTKRNIRNFWGEDLSASQGEFHSFTLCLDKAHCRPSPKTSHYQLPLFVSKLTPQCRLDSHYLKINLLLRKPKIQQCCHGTGISFSMLRDNWSSEMSSEMSNTWLQRSLLLKRKV